MLLPIPTNVIDALVIVDMQNFFFQKPERRVGLDTVLANINRLIDHFDRSAQAVIHVRSAFHSDRSDWDLKMLANGEPELIDDSAEAELLPQIKVMPQHIHIIKTRYSSFFRTGLANQLNALGVRRVMVTGAYTHYCVNATVFDAYANDFVPGLISDAVISHLADESEVMIARMRRNGYHVMTTEEYLSKP
jgi:NAD+ synthase